MYWNLICRISIMGGSGSGGGGARENAGRPSTASRTEKTMRPNNDCGFGP